MRKYKNKLQCLGTESQKRHNTKFIFRFTTPYAQPRFLKRHSNRFVVQSPLHYEHNSLGLHVLWDTFNWNILDTWTMLRKREDLTEDGGHYTGVGSRTITYQLLEILVHNIPPKISHSP